MTKKKIISPAKMGQLKKYEKIISIYESMEDTFDSVTDLRDYIARRVGCSPMTVRRVIDKHRNN